MATAPSRLIPAGANPAEGRAGPRRRRQGLSASLFVPASRRPGRLVRRPVDPTRRTTSRAGSCLDCDIPFAWQDGSSEPPIVEPFPQGFALTVPVSPGAETAPGTAALDRYAEVAVALGRCWSSSLAAGDAHWSDVTLRVSFRRDGAVNGQPRVVHVTAPADAAAQERGRQSLLAALGRCTPLPFSAGLGRAIAGQIFAIRFVQQRNS